MRAGMFFLGVAVLFVCAFAASPLQPPAAPARPAAKSEPGRINDILAGWEKKSGDARDFKCKFDRISTDAVFGAQAVEHGVASGVKPYTGRLDLLDDNNNFTQIFIFSGTKLHQYEFKTKQEIVHLLPAPKPGSSTIPGPMAFIFGMTAAEARSRFDLKLAREFNRNGVDYAEIHAEPKTNEDIQEFKMAKIVIEKKTFLPRQILIEEPNGSTQDWRFTGIESNVNPPITAANKDFQPLEPPKDWKKTEKRWGDVNAAAQPGKTKGTPAAKSKNEAARPGTPKR